MSRLRSTLAGIVVAALTTSCGSDVASPGAQLNGQWMEVVSFPGVSTTLQLSVADTTVTGTGNYTIEAGKPGTIVVSGVISGSQVRLDLARSDGATQHFQGSLVAPDLLSGISFYQDPISDSYRRVIPQ